jgi:hypothetical protein
LDFAALEKASIEDTTDLASPAIVAICCGVGELEIPLTLLFSFDSELSIAEVSFGKSFLADETSEFAWLWIVCSCVLSELRLVVPLRFLTDPWSLLKSEQKAGLLLPPQLLMSAALTSTHSAIRGRLAGRWTTAQRLVIAVPPSVSVARAPLHLEAPGTYSLADSR